LFFTDYDVILIAETSQARLLANKYLEEKVVPASEPLDALHIAIASVSGVDFIVSLNFEHIVRPWTIERIRRINLQEGFKPVGIYKPNEVKEVLELL
jgi:hypothetical protein